MNSGPRFRDALQEIPGYRAGKRPDPRTDGVEAFKVSSNENPYPPLPQVVKVIEQAAHHVNRYPDPGSAELIEAIAAHAGVPREHVAVATGAVTLCYQFAQSTAGPGDEVVFAWRSFEAYPIVTSVAGAQPVAVPLLADGRHDMAALAAAVTDRTRLVFICSPNNPTGTVVTQDELDEFMAAVPNDVMVVLDEAYIEFSRDPSAAAGLVTYTKASEPGCAANVFQGIWPRRVEGWLRDRPTTGYRGAQQDRIALWRIRDCPGGGRCLPCR